MKTIVTVSKINESAQPYKHVEIVTSLYGEDGDDFGLASISFDQFGCFSFKVQLRYVSHTLAKWEEIYNTRHFGSDKAWEIYNSLLSPLIAEEVIGGFNKYHVVNDFSDDQWEEKATGWNKVLEEVNDFLKSIDPEFRVLPTPEEVDDEEEHP